MKPENVTKQLIICLAVLVFLVGAAQAETIIIGGAVGNGDFEDFSGGWVEAGGTAGLSGTYPNYTRIWRSAGLDLTFGIDGWTARYRTGYVSFDRRTDGVQPGDTGPSENRSFNLNQWSLAHLTSDTYAVIAAESDQLKLTFDTAGNFMRFNAYVIFDEGTGNEWTHYFVGTADGYADFITTDHTDIQNAPDYSLTFGSGQSASTVKLVFSGYRADQGGADYGMIKRNAGTGILDNIELTVAEAVPPTDYYVATVANGGDDSNPGTLAEPFATIQHAATQIQPGYAVYIRGGVYRETVTPPTSGSNGLPITFQAYNDEEVVVSGCDLIEGWIHDSGDIWKATVNWDVGTDGAGNTVFADGHLKHEARQGAENDPWDIDDWGQIPHGNLTTDYIIADDIAGLFPDDYWNGAKIMHHTCDGCFPGNIVADFESATGKITFEDPYDSITQKGVYGYYIYGTLLALDKPGEWFKDSDTDTLYYQVDPGTEPNELEIEFKNREYAFDVRGRDYIHIKGLIFRGQSIQGDAYTGYNVYQDNIFYGYHTGYSSRFYITGNYNIFRDNEVSHTWMSAISIGGVGTQIVNNYFHDIGYQARSSVLDMGGSNHLVSHNTVRKFGRAFLDGYPTDSEFCHNLFEDGAKLSWDTGIFDGDRGGGNGGRSIVHHNLFRNTPARGIYCAFYAGQDLDIHHNIVHDITGSGPSATLRVSQLQFVKYYHNTLIGLNPVGNTNAADVAFQARYNNNLQITADYITSIGMNCRGNYDYSESDFIDFNGKDFRLAASSGAIDSGILIPKINDNYSGAAPDAGALEYDEAMFEVGHDFANPPTPTYAWEPMPGMNLFSNGQFKDALSGWTYINTPIRIYGNSWNSRSSLAKTANYSVKMHPGDGMYRTFDNLYPDTWYAVCTETRLVDQRIEMEQYDNISGSVTTGSHRNENYIIGLDDGESVRYDNIDFGSAGKYNQLELTFSRPVGTPAYSTVSSLEVRLDSDTGQLLGTFEYNPSIQDSWRQSVIDISALSGTNNIVFIGKGPDSGIMMLASVRLINNNMIPDNRASVIIDNHGGPTVTTRVGDPYWQERYEIVVFKTGPAATSARLTIRNDGIYDAYLDRLAIYEIDEFNNQLPTYTQVSTSSGSSAANAVDGNVYTEAVTDDQPNSWLLLELDSPLDMHQITLTASSPSPGHLSNFKVSVWANDPQYGGSALWQRSYITSGSMAAGETLFIKPTDMSSDGVTQLNDLVARYVKVELLGQNNLGNGILEIAEIDVQGYDEMDMTITDGLTSSTGSMHEVAFVQVVNIGRITLYNVDSEDYKELSNFTVSVWDRDPSLGGSIIWEKDYFQTGCVARGDHFHIPGSEIGKDGTTRLGSLMGRIIRITNNETNNAGNTNLTLDRVRIYNVADARPEANVAMSGIASQSSDHYGNEDDADKAINGVILPISDFTTTTNSPQPWWQVDIMDNYKINQIVLFNRTDAASRIGNFRVSVWDGDPESSGTEVWGKDYSYSAGDLPAGGSLSINGNVTSGSIRLDELTNARFVRVQLHGSNLLSLVEVQVWVDIPASPDMDRNDKINLVDFVRFSQCWLNHTREEADFTNDDLVNSDDLVELTDRWLEGMVVY